MKKVFYLFLILVFPLFAAPGDLIKEKQEKLIVGKAGKGFKRRLLNRGSGAIEEIRIVGNSLQKSFLEEKKTPGPQLIPNFSNAEEIEQLYEEYQSENLIELYFEMPPLPENRETSLIFEPLFNWKSMEGVQYFSTTIQRMTTYIERIDVVAAVGEWKAITFSTPSSFPDKPLELIILQDDNKFAPCWYQFKVEALEEQALSIQFSNASELQIPFLFFRFKALAAGDMLHKIYLIPHKDRLEIYSISLIRNAVQEILGRKLDLANSFDRRMSAVQSWIYKQLYES